MMRRDPRNNAKKKTNLSMHIEPVFCILPQLGKPIINQLEQRRVHFAFVYGQYNIGNQLKYAQTRIPQL